MIDKELIKNIRSKRKVSLQAIYQSLKGIRKKYKNTISKEEAAYIFASDCGIDIYKYLKHDEITREKITKLLSSKSDSLDKQVVAKVKTKDKTFKILKIKEITIDDVLLPHRIFDDAKKMSEIYTIIYVFENSIRNFLKKAMDRAFPDGWWNEKRIPTIPKKKAESRKEEEGKNLWHGKRSTSNMLDYVDFDELENIISKNTETLTPYFKGLPKDLEWLKIKIREIYPSRNVLAHNNPLSEHDMKRVQVICTDWQRQLPVLKSKLEENQSN